METTETKNNDFVKRVVKAFSEMPETLPETQGQIGNRKYTYVPLPTILNTIRPILAKHDLAIRQETSSYLNEEGEEIKTVSVETIVFASDGEIRSKPISISVHTPIGGSMLQGLGATLTYLRRYSITAFLGLATESDTDGVVDTNGHKIEKEHQRPTEEPLDVNYELIEAKKRIKKMIRDAFELGILDEDTARAQKKALDSISTISATAALEKAIKRLVDRKRDEISKQAKGADNGK